MDSGDASKYILLGIVLSVFSLLGGYLYIANKRMYEAGIHQ